MAGEITTTGDVANASGTSNALANETIVHSTFPEKTRSMKYTCDFDLPALWRGGHEAPLPYLKGVVLDRSCRSRLRLRGSVGFLYRRHGGH